jgi:hypothetical protein
MKSDNQSVSEKIEKELKKMKKKLDGENLALNKILKCTTLFKENETVRNIKKKNNNNQI